MITTSLCALVAFVQGPQGDLQKLEFLLGNWESREVSRRADGTEVAFTLKGTNTWALKGRYLKIEEAFSVPNAGEHENLILIGFDPAEKNYRAAWYTSNSPLPMQFVGQWQDKDLILTSEGTASRPALRIIYHPLQDGFYKAELEIKRGEKWETATRAEYRRTPKETSAPIMRRVNWGA